MSMTSKAYSYTRFSSSDQARGDSERRQTEAAQAYAAAHGLELDATHRDLGRSGFSGAHRKGGAMQAFLTLIQRGQVARGSVLIIEAIDRLSRERFNDAYRLFSQIVEAGITIVTLEDGASYSPSNYDDLGKIIPLVVKITGAHEYSKRLAMRMTAARSQAVKVARENGRPVTMTCPRWLRINADRTGFEEIPERVAIVRKIFEWTALGDGSNNVAKRLNREKTPLFDLEGQGIKQGTRLTAACWLQSYVAKIVTSRAVLGEYQPRTERVADGGKRQINGEPISDYYPAIIDIDLFNKAQEARRTNAVAGGGHKNMRVSNLLSGKVYCAHCSGRMNLVAREVGKQQYEYLYCRSAVSKGACEKATGAVNYHKLQKAILDRLEWMDRENILVEQATQAGSEIEKDVTRLTLSIEAGEKRLEALMSGEITDQMRKVMLKQSNAIDALEADLKAARKRLEDARPATSMVEHKAALRALQAMVNDGDYDSRLRIRTALRSLIDRIDCDTISKTSTVSVARGAYSFMVLKKGETTDFGKLIERYGEENVEPVFMPPVDGEPQAHLLNQLLSHIATAKKANKSPEKI
jgi:DNA invertase Pin-like site-specific DNA recombinase